MKQLKNIMLSSEIPVTEDFKNNPELVNDLSAETTGFTEICKILNILKNTLRGTACVAFSLVAFHSFSATSVDSSKLKDLIGNDYVVTNVLGLNTLADKEMVVKTPVSDIVDPAYTNSIAWKVAHMYSGEGGRILENDPIWLEWRYRSWMELGSGATVSNKSEGVAIGKNAYMGAANYGVAIGSGVNATGDMATGIGIAVRAIGNQSVAIGKTPYAIGNKSTAIGYYATADGDASTAIGGNSHADGLRSMANGWAASARGLNSTAVGNGAIVETNTVGCGAFGSGAEVDTNTTNSYQIGFGKNTESNTLKFMDKRVATWEDVSNIIYRLGLIVK